MRIEGLGELTLNRDIEEWLDSKPVDIPFLAHAQLSFTLESIEDDPSPNEFVEAISNFLAMTEADRATATPHIYKVYIDFVDAVDEEDVHIRIEDEAKVWDHVRLSAIRVSRRPRGDKEVHVQIVGNCDWEIEHGFQLVFRRGNILRRVSDQDGHLTYCDAYAAPESEDRIC